MPIYSFFHVLCVHEHYVIIRRMWQGLIPNKGDWALLTRVYKDLNSSYGIDLNDKLHGKLRFAFSYPFIIKEKEIFITNISDDNIRLGRLISYLARYFWDSAPPPILSLANKNKSNDFMESSFSDEIELYSNIFLKDSLDRTRIMEFMQILEDEEIVKSCNYSEWLKYGEEVASFPKDFEDEYIKKKNTKLFPLTAKGTLYYEYLINSPSMFHNYRSSYMEPELKTTTANQYRKNSRSQNRYNTATYPLIFLSFASRGERLSLLRDYPTHFKQSKHFVVHDYHENIMQEQERVLGNNYGFFVEMHNPATKILREIRALYELASEYDLNPNDSFKFNYNDPSKLVETLFIKKIYNDVQLLEEIWVEFLGLDHSLIKKHLPEDCI